MRHRPIFLTIVLAGAFLLRLFFPSLFAPLESLQVGSSSTAILPPGHSALVPLRFFAAYVFVWFALDNFESPRQFHAIGNLVLRKLGVMREIPLAWLSYTQGDVELLVAVSLVTGMMLAPAALTGSVIVALVILAFKLGNGTLLVRDLGVLGATISLYLLTK